MSVKEFGVGFKDHEESDLKVWKNTLGNPEGSKRILSQNL